MINFMSIDVEDYESLVNRDFFGVLTEVSSSVVDCTLRFLDILDEAGVTATCFCLGLVAKAKPELIREIHGRGFEVASHGMNHLFYSQYGVDEAYQDMKDAKDAIEDVLGEEITGFRAPAFNVSLKRPELIEAIVKAGYKYDSSIFPFQGRRYGCPESPRSPYRIGTRAGDLIEFHLSTVRVRGKRIPAAGGGYLRHFPYFLNAKAIRSINEEGIPVVVYLHPQECFEGKFNLLIKEADPKTQLKAALFDFNQSVGRKRTIKKLTRLTEDFQFTAMRNFFSSPQYNERGLLEVSVKS